MREVPGSIPGAAHDVDVNDSAQSLRKLHLKSFLVPFRYCQASPTRPDSVIDSSRTPPGPHAPGLFPDWFWISPAIAEPIAAHFGTQARAGRRIARCAPPIINPAAPARPNQPYGKRRFWDATCKPSADVYTKNNCLHFPICARHPCAGAMLIFSVSFRF